MPFRQLAARRHQYIRKIGIAVQAEVAALRATRSDDSLTLLVIIFGPELTSISTRLPNLLSSVSTPTMVTFQR